jgi:hypothetical protein
VARTMPAATRIATSATKSGWARSRVMGDSRKPDPATLPVEG